jgi:hypothetical protein
MIVIRFIDSASERRALGYLAGRFSYTTRDSGEVLVPDQALAYLAHEGLKFSVQGTAHYEQNLPPVRGTAAPSI